jgi:hypothetical protein
MRTRYCSLGARNRPCEPVMMLPLFEPVMMLPSAVCWEARLRLCPGGRGGTPAWGGCCLTGAYSAGCLQATPEPWMGRRRRRLALPSGG